MRKPTTTLGAARLQKSSIPVSEREKVSTLDSGMIKQYSPSVQARNNTFRAQEVNGSCWMRSSRYPGVSHIVMDQLVEGLLSLAGEVPEVNPIAMALRKEQPKCRADSQRVGLSRVHRGVYCSSSRS